MRLAKQVRLVLTYDCPHNCNYCYNDIRPQMNRSKYVTSESSHADSSPEKISQIVAESARNGISEICITGGEPLMRKDLFYAGLQAAKDWAFHISVNTNLVLVNEDDIKALKDANANILTSMPHYTREGFNRMTNSVNYDKFLGKLWLSREYGLNLAANMVLTKENWQDVYEEGKFLYQAFGVKKFSGSPIIAADKSHLSKMLSAKEVEKAFDMLLKLRDDFGLDVACSSQMVPCFSKTPEKYAEFTSGCSMIRSEISILADGKVKACDSIPMIYGNIFESPLETLISSMDPFMPYENLSLHASVPEVCKPCAEVVGCRGGCRMASKVAFGDYKAQNPYFLQALDRMITGKYVELPDFSRGSLELVLPEQGSHRDDLLLFVSNENKFSQEEQALIAIVAQEVGKSQIFDPNFVRIKYKINSFIFDDFLSKMNELSFIRRPKNDDAC
jgi:radical SAM protein with 4Fe4S-binding SPASM domain